jgi:hypothetical protein
MPEEDQLAEVSKEDYQDYETILSDLQHNLELSPTEQINRFRADPWSAFSGLKAANGFDLPLSREAQNRFVRIATRGLKGLGTSARLHSLERVVEELKGELSSVLLSGLVPDLDYAHELFNSAIRKLEREYVELTYHVPCSVVAERSYASFTIGPVTFVLRDQFFEENEAAINKAIADFGHPQTRETLVARVRSFYSDFNGSLRSRFHPAIRRSRGVGPTQGFKRLWTYSSSWLAPNGLET